MFGRNKASTDVEDWLLGQFQWAIDAGLLRPDTPLVLPTEDFFTARSGPPDQLVPAVVRDILKLMNRSEDHIDCLPINRPGAEIRAVESFQSLGEVAGAWNGDEESSVVFYDPEMASRPLLLLSTMAHEAMHHVLHRHFPDDLLEGLEEELQTDAQMITSGFGLLAMMGAEEAGWAGYMRQPTRAHALAMFHIIRGLPLTQSEDRLTSRMKRALKSSYSQLERSSELAKLRENLSARAA